MLRKVDTKGGGVIFRFRSIRARIIFSSSLFLLIVGPAIIAYATIYVRNFALHRTKDQVRFIAQDYATHAQYELNKAMDSLNLLAIILRKVKDPIEPMNIEREQVDTLLQSILIQNNNFLDVYTCWLPNAFDGKDKYYENEPGHDNTGRFAIHWYRNEYGIIDVEPCSYVHKKGPNDNLLAHKVTKQPFITDPHIHKIGGKDQNIISLVTPINVKEKYYGIVGVDLKAEVLQRLIEKEIGIRERIARVTILSQSQKIIATTNMHNLPGENASKTIEYMNRYVDEIAYGKEFNRKFNDEIVFFAPIKTFTPKPWWVIVSIARVEITAEASALSTQLIFVGVGCIILSIIFSWLLSSSLVKPLSLLVKSVKQIGGGDYAHVVKNVGSSDEIRELATAFNNMSLDIKNRELERNKNQKALRGNEASLASIFRAAPTGIGVVYDRVIHTVNDRLCEMTGYLKEELVNQSARILYPSDQDFEYVGKEKYRQIQDHGTGTVETKLQCKDGKTIHVLLSSTPIDVKNLSAGVTFTVLDITLRKKAELELRESETKYRSMMESMKDLVYICSADYRVEYMNPAMIKRTGRNAIGEYCFKALHNFDQKCPWCKQKKMLENVHFEMKNTSPKDNRSYHVSISPVVHENGSVSKMIILRDTTDLKKIELQLQQAQKMESIGTLAGGIAHDFNNILFPILGHSEMLLEDVPEDSPFRNSLNQIFTSALRASELVKQILTFSRQESSELKLMKMQPIIKEALKLIRSTIPTTIEIKQYIKTDCGVIKADPTQIHQIVMNLATNAYHAMEETGGELKVTLKQIELGEHEVITPDMTPGAYACLTISDTGIGMDKELIEKIFDPFFTTKKQGKGTGMGLSVAHGIVISMGGTIQVYSEPGKGTQFNVYFPLEKIFLEEQINQDQNKQNILGGTKRILLVDDETGIITMEKQMLERLGYHVTSRTSSLEALEAFRANPDKFDLVITDMAMPNMPGDKLSVGLTKIRPDIPILLCTGFSENMSEEKVASLGIKGFLFKPIVMKNLAGKIREVLDGNNGVLE